MGVARCILGLLPKIENAIFRSVHFVDWFVELKKIY